MTAASTVQSTVTHATLTGQMVKRTSPKVQHQHEYFLLTQLVMVMQYDRQQGYRSEDLKKIVRLIQDIVSVILAQAILVSHRSISR